MTIEATAAALATDTAMPEQVASDAIETTEDDDLGAIWDKGDAPEEEQEADLETPDKPEAEATDDASEEGEEPDAEDKPEDTEAPSELPRGVKEHWKDIPETARAAILESQREMSRKLGDQGRLMQGISPIRDALVKAAETIPALNNMRPQEVAEVAFRYANLEQQFQSRPVETMIGLVKQHGLEQAMQQALAGQMPTADAKNENALRQQITRLERQLQQVADPEYLREQVTQINSQSQMIGEVDRFSTEAEHWSDVESEMPRFIQAVQQLSPNASAQDVLKEAYDLAVQRLVPEAKRAKPAAAPEAAKAPTDPAKTEAARKAKSVNVRDTSTGKFRELTEDEELAAAYSRMQS